MIYFGKDSAVKIEMQKWFDIRLVVQYQAEIVIITGHLRMHQTFRDVTKWIKNEFRWHVAEYFENDFGGFEDGPVGIVTFDRKDATTSADYIYA